MTIRVVAAVLVLVIVPTITSAQSNAVISANDNRRPAGTLANGALTVNLVAERGQWRPEAGTFIYHEHSADDDQLGGGLYGPLIVLEPGQRFDPTTDHIFIAGHDGPEFEGQPREPVVVNGKAAVPAGTPVNVPLRAGVPNRLRLINITPGLPALTFVLTDGFNTVAWTPVGKDGAELSPAARVSREARQLIAVGETYDFEITPKTDERLWLNLVRGNGEWVVQTRLVVRP